MAIGTKGITEMAWPARRVLFPRLADQKGANEIVRGGLYFSLKHGLSQPLPLAFWHSPALWHGDWQSRRLIMLTGQLAILHLLRHIARISRAVWGPDCRTTAYVPWQFGPTYKCWVEFSSTRHSATGDLTLSRWPPAVKASMTT